LITFDISLDDIRPFSFFTLFRPLTCFRFRRQLDYISIFSFHFIIDYFAYFSFFIDIFDTDAAALMQLSRSDAAAPAVLPAAAIDCFH